MPDRSRKRPRDLNQLAARLVDEATADEPPVSVDPDQSKVPEPERQKDAAAVSLGRRGGLKGGKARAEKLTAEQRSEIARKAAATRWKDRESRRD